MSANSEPSIGPVADLRRDGIPATGDLLAELRHALIQWAKHTCLAQGQIEDLALATHEAMANVVMHAYADRAAGTFDLHASHQAHDGIVAITVTDHGQWQPSDADRRPLHGRGLRLIHALATHVTISSTEHGTTVRMIWSPTT